MEARIYMIKDRCAAKKILEDDRLKRTGYTLQEIDGREYVYIKGEEEIFRLIEESGAFERPENEEELKKKFEEAEESANTGVGSFLGF